MARIVEFSANAVPTRCLLKLMIQFAMQEPDLFLACDIHEDEASIAVELVELLDSGVLIVCHMLNQVHMTERHASWLRLRTIAQPGIRHEPLVRTRFFVRFHADQFARESTETQMIYFDTLLRALSDLRVTPTSLVRPYRVYICLPA